MKKSKIVAIIGAMLFNVIILIIIYLDTPPNQKETFTLWVFSDIHTDLENLSIAIQDMNNVEWDEALVLGDIIDNPYYNNTRWEYEQVREVFKQSNHPFDDFHFILGNHDNNCYENDTCFADGHEIFVKDPWYVFDRGNLHFIMTSTNNCPKNIKCNIHAYEHIEKNLELRKINIIVTHHPYIRLNNSIPSYPYYFVLLNGHTHRYFDSAISFLEFNRGVEIDDASITNIRVNETTFPKNVSRSALSRIIIFEGKNIKILSRDSKKHKFMQIL